METASNSEIIVKPKAKPRGRPFQKGHVANPTGRPKVDLNVVFLARQQTTKAIETLIRCLSSENENVAVRAAEALLNRGHGTPIQTVNNLNPSETKINVVWNHADGRNKPTEPTPLTDRNITQASAV